MISPDSDLRGSISVKVLAIGLLILLLLAPVAMIRGVIDDRLAVGREARQDIVKSWGGEQTVSGPVLVLPLQPVEPSERDRSGRRAGQVLILPETLIVDVELDSEMRHRGLHDIPAYTASAKMKATFAPPDLTGLGIDSARVQWGRAAVALSIRDARAARRAPEITVGGERMRFAPARAPISQLTPQLAAPLSVYRSEASRSQPLTVSIDFTISGTQSFMVQPLGDETRVNMRADWPDPSFTGDFLPVSHEITESGFSARWRTTSLGRPLPGMWMDGKLQMNPVGSAGLGVALFVPIDLYRLTDRATRYAVMFIGLTFVAYFLFEVLGGLRLHPLQYLLVGFGNAIFYLLLLSLAEHIGFGPAYLLSAATSAGLIAGYSLAILGSRTRASLMLGGLSLLYGLLYMTLQAETYAMLAGSVGLWCSLALIMYLTRRIDWYAVGGDDQKGHP